MVGFDFVSDEALRASLERDSVEMNACMTAGAYKAVVVLAGSIVEAVLTDHLDSVGYEDPKGKDLLELDLGGLISAARTQKVLSAKSADLSSVVRGYRNLIHPGRSVRLGETVDAATAAVAGHLVEIVTTEVAALKVGTYGYTAQQIVSKVENDSSSIPILRDLLLITNAKETERLLIEDLPARYFELSVYEDEDSVLPRAKLNRLAMAYRLAFEAAREETKKRVAKNYARVLREETSEYKVLTYERSLFRCTDLRWMAAEDAAMAKKHLLSQIRPELIMELGPALVGIGKFATQQDLVAIIDTWVKHVAMGDSPSRRKFAGEALQRLLEESPAELDESMFARMREWEEVYKERSPSLAGWLASERTKMESYVDLPF